VTPAIDVVFDINAAVPVASKSSAPLIANAPQRDIVCRGQRRADAPKSFLMGPPG